MNKPYKTVLITGGGGFLGSVMVPLLLKRGYMVIVLDRFFFGKQVFDPYIKNKKLTLVHGDSRWIKKGIFKHIHAVIDLAALSNDPLAELDPALTKDINFRARIRMAKLAKNMGVKRYILASSCSVYGNQNGLLTEKTKPAPLTTYARMNILAEDAVLSLGNNDFIVTALRQGTLYGLSPRMRFDLVVNTMTLSAYKQNKIFVSGGQQWRPLIHVKDSAHAFIKVLEARPKQVQKQIFNTGATKHNFQMLTLANRLASVLKPRPDIVNVAGYDTRSYRVSCEKIRKKLGFTLQYTPEKGAQEIYHALHTGTIDDSLQTKTLEWYKKLIKDNPGILTRKLRQTS